MPVGDDGNPDDEYGRAGGAIKARISETVLRYAPAVDYVGARYKLAERLSLAAYASRFEDIWHQYYGNANYVMPLSQAQALTFDVNLYRTLDTGSAKAGTIDTTAAGLQAAYKVSSHTFTAAYQDRKSVV